MACHRWIFDRLGGDAVWRRTKSDEAFFLSLRVGYCKNHSREVHRGCCLFPRWKGLQSTAKTCRWVCGSEDYQVFEIGITHEEFERLRCSSSPGIYSGAPANVHQSNLYLATHREKGMPTGSNTESAAFKQIFPYLAGVISAGYGGADDYFGRSCLAKGCSAILSSVGILRRLSPSLEDGAKLSFEPRKRPTRGTAGGGGLAAAVEPVVWLDDQSAPGDTGTAPAPASHPKLDTAGPAEPSSGTPAEVEAGQVVSLGVSPSLLPGVATISDPEHWQHGAIAVKYLPAIEERLFYLSTVKRVQQAIKGRIDDPFVEVTMTEKDREDMKLIVDEFLCQMERGKGKFMEIATTLLFGDYVPKKWTAKRAQAGVERLRQRYNPAYRFTGSVKLEPSKAGKPPRLLIADGDEGQVMAWLLLGTLEKWVFHTYRGRSIKGASKDTEMSLLGSKLNQKTPRKQTGVKERELPSVKVDIVENDGSAWDACMGADLRDQTENRIMDRAAEYLRDIVTVWSPNEWTDARLASNKLEEIKMAVKSKSLSVYDSLDLPDEELFSGKPSIRMIIRAIRRSGCRGTSILNWLGNMLCWCFCIGGAEGASLIAPQGVKVRCRDGRVRFVRMVFEGDDSILSFYCEDGTRLGECDFLEMCGAAWTRLGHRPKLFHRKQVAEFCGYHFCINDFGLTGLYAPDLRRQLVSAAYCSNKLAVEAALTGDWRKLGMAVGPGLISRAYALAVAYPSIARCFFNLGTALLGRQTPVLNWDDIYALELDEAAPPPVYKYGDEDSELWFLRKVRWEDIITRTDRRINESLVSGFGNLDESAVAVRLRALEDEEDWWHLVAQFEMLSIGLDEQSFQANVNHWLLTRDATLR